MQNRKKSTKGDAMRGAAALMLAVLMVVTVGCGGSGSKANTANIPADAKMLNFTIPDVHGNEVNMRQHYGKVVIVDFWDTWCGPCRKEIPHFVELYDQYKNQGLEIVGVAFARNGTQAVKDFTAENKKINYINGLFNQEAQNLFGSPPSIPTTYIIDRNGNVAEKVVGYRDKAYWEGKVKALLKS